MQVSLPEITTAAALEEKQKLQKGLGYVDMIFFTAAALIGLDTLGAFSANGAQALTWLFFSAATFLVPYGLLTAELGSTFTKEGGVYEWCKLAGGRFYAALTAMLYWVSNPFWLAGTLSVGAIAAIKTFWFGSTNYQFGGTKASDAFIELAIALLFIWGTVWFVIMSLRFGKWLSVFGSYVKLMLLAIFMVLGIIFIVGGYSKGVHFSTADLIPGDWGVVGTAILPVLIFQWVGFEVQNGAAEEMHDPQRDVPRSIIRAGTIAAVTYALFLIVILFALPTNQLTGVGSFLNAYQAVNGVLPATIAKVLGWLVAGGLVIAYASSGGTWLMGADRTYAVSALDRTAPRMFGRFSKKYGTPVAVNIMSGVMATIAVAAAIMVTAFGSGAITTLFSLVLGFTLSTNTLAYLFIFPAFLILRYKYPDVPRTYRVPGGMIGAWIVTLLPFIYAAIAGYYILIPADSYISKSGVNRPTYELTQFIPLAVIILLTIVFYIWGQNEKRNQDVVVGENIEGVGGVAGD
ncbi:MAG TPA: APC family permease [Ktedonobacteraceae bacterium]|nr:APC family permease [Ktedonobacteraceae bacterium]